MKRTCCAKHLEDVIGNTPDGGTCVLESREYYLERQIHITHKKHIVIDGNGSVIVSHFNNGSSDIDTCDSFHLRNCDGVTLCNFILDTDVPVNLTGMVSGICKENHSYIFTAHPSYSLSGRETFMMQDSCNENGSFDHKLEYYHRHPDENIVTLLANEILLASTYTGCHYNYLGHSRYEVFLPPERLTSLFVGQKICVRHHAYGPIAILIKNSKNTAIKNVTIHSAGGMGIVVLPRSENLILERFQIRPRADSVQLMAGNCDGVHITGLSGELIMKDCYFDGLGDDALNIHSTAATVTDIHEREDRLTCHYCKKTKDGLLSPEWCKKGDEIVVLDAQTCQKKGGFRVISFEKEELLFEKAEGLLSVGSILQNRAFAASVNMTGCTIRNTRARGCILQSENIDISDCTFYGMSFPAIQAAPDVRKWYEVGPVINMSIHHNTFENCGCAVSGSDIPVIAVKNNHDKLCADIDPGIKGVHKNVRITDNLFLHKSGRCIFLTSTDGVEIYDNLFMDCPEEDGRCRIETVACSNSNIVNP